MRVAIFSDVHGNLQAMQAVIADIEAQGTFDEIVFAGDLVFGGGDPLACLDLMRDKGYVGVYGNTDEWLWSPFAIPEDADEETRKRLEGVLQVAAWTREQIGAGGVAFLQFLPFAKRISPTDDPAQDLLIVHANPKNVHDPIFPANGRQPDEEVLPLLADVSAKTIAFGHIHHPNVRRIGDYTLANISSVSRPIDGDWRAKYGILTFQDGTWQVEKRTVEYDVQAARTSLLTRQMPDAENAANLLLLPPEG